MPSKYKVIVPAMFAIASGATRSVSFAVPSPQARLSFSYSSTVSINYEKHGSGIRSLVLLPGFGASLETWRDIEPLLSPWFTLYLVDLKGEGLSSKPDDGQYAPRDHAKIIAAFLDYVKGDRVILVGNSYGGGIALQTYFELPEDIRTLRIGGIVLIDAAGYRQRLPSFIEVLRVPVLNRIVPHMMTADQRARFVLKKAFYDDSKVTPERVSRYSLYLKLPGSLGALRSTAQQMIPGDLNSFMDRIKQVSVSTLIIWGDNDVIIPKDYARRFHADIAESTLKIISKCGHVPQEEKPEETASAIRDFVGSL